MNEEYTNKLVTTFPKLYSWSKCFDCSDGWFQLIWDLSEKLEPLMEEVTDKRETYVPCCASQVKEKFGTLRFYTMGCTDEMDKHIDEAVAKSAITCELCGSPGTLRPGGWWATLCDGCNKK